MNQRTLSDDHVTHLVRDAAAAPSMHNTQPWRFRYLRGGRVFEMRAAPGRVLPHSDPLQRALHLGCDAALLNLRVALVHEGWYPQARLRPDPADPGLLATVRPAALGTAGSGLAAPYPAIHRRHSNRHPFDDTRIPNRRPPGRVGLRGRLAQQVRLGDHTHGPVQLVHHRHGGDVVVPQRLHDLPEGHVAPRPDHVPAHELCDRAVLHVSSPFRSTVPTTAGVTPAMTTHATTSW